MNSTDDCGQRAVSSSRRLHAPKRRKMKKLADRTVAVCKAEVFFWATLHCAKRAWCHFFLTQMTHQRCVFLMRSVASFMYFLDDWNLPPTCSKMEALIKCTKTLFIASDAIILEGCPLKKVSYYENFVIDGITRMPFSFFHPKVTKTRIPA